ncbi:uncharacterized protein G2W53_000771 [Senna tora]|uniref:Uncharacterized protein n=1 Tax=Senna tora TaxID=362788 RepID=A0A835CI06_9FABA|nr:uncharacterized protein G2W53_000771 [Senna tora]
MRPSSSSLSFRQPPPPLQLLGSALLCLSSSSPLLHLCSVSSSRRNFTEGQNWT